MDLEEQQGQIAVTNGESLTPESTAKLPGSEFAWKDVSFSVKTKDGEKQILSNISGCVQEGKLLALMGPSGCGKTTLLDILARRLKSDSVTGTHLLGGSTFDSSTLRAISTYVEQDDHLIGSLTVRETVEFAAKLALPSMNRRQRKERTVDLLREFGLLGVKDTRIGTPLQRGVSGGQKKRVTTASQLITLPKIIFLDEPTSGLDSTASHEIISCLKTAAQEYGMIVIASIHQPATSTFLLFDQVLLLSEGKSVYFGPPSSSQQYFESHGYPHDPFLSPAESMLQFVNTDFGSHDEGRERLDRLVASWQASSERQLLLHGIEHGEKNNEVATLAGNTPKAYPRSLPVQVGVQLHRLFLKAYRDPLAYGVRIAMYLGLAILMGTAWLRLDYSQWNIQNIINSLFFGCAFMSFMAVAYIPAFLEDRAVYVKERANGLYGSVSFLLANLIIGIPFVFLIALLFSVVTYWLLNLRPTADAFFNYLAILYLDLLAAESLVVLISAIFPIFVVALALTAFANGLWMTVGGYMITPTVLNVFWKYTFYQIDYQRYAFSLLVRNQMVGSVYECGSGCECMYVTSLAGQCQIDGAQAVDQLGYTTNNALSYGLLIAITIAMRILAWLALYYRRR